MTPTSRPRPRLSDVVRSWEDQAGFALELVRRALEQLYVQRHQDAGFTTDEDELSKDLGGHLNELVNRQGASHGLPWISPPSYDGIQGQDPLYKGLGEHEDKRPDIRFEIRDALDEEGSHKSLTIECKRLGSSTSGHSLNKEYVEKGIVRFHRQSHRYGVYSAWGVMIGYVQSSSYDLILQQVNGHARSAGLPEIGRLDSGWQPITSNLQHEFDRPFEISPFRLLHLWVDLRPLPSA